MIAATLEPLEEMATPPTSADVAFGGQWPLSYGRFHFSVRSKFVSASQSQKYICDFQSVFLAGAALATSTIPLPFPLDKRR
jgi:hypothetical protein